MQGRKEDAGKKGRKPYNKGRKEGRVDMDDVEDDNDVDEGTDVVDDSDVEEDDVRCGEYDNNW